MPHAIAMMLDAGECGPRFSGCAGRAGGGLDRSKPLSQRPRLRSGDWTEWGKRLTQVADRTLAEGVRVAYHHHMGTIVESADDIDALMNATGPSVSLLLDTGHATWGGADPVALARKYRARIAHFHAKDVRKPILDKARAGDWSFLDAILGQGDELGVYTVPGDGVVDYPAVFAELQGLFRLGRGRSRTGSEKGEPAGVCEERCRAFASVAASSRINLANNINAVIARSSCDEAIQSSFLALWIASLRSQ